MRFINYFILAIFVTIISTSNSLAQLENNNGSESTIKKIEISNNQRVETSTIESYLELSVGDKFDQKKINESLKSMFSTGLFSDISVSREGSTLKIKVDENPVINRVVFDGNKKIKDDIILSEIELKSRSVYTRAKVQKDTKRIQDIYRKSGRFAINVEPKVIPLSQNRVDLFFEITEGKKTKISKIYFVGNKHYDSNKLKKILNTSESRWYSFYSGSDTYDPDRVAFDKELLRKFYTSRGYADFRVLSSTAEITKDKKSFVLTFTIEEGQKYSFGNMNIVSKLDNVKVEDLYELIKSKENEVFNSELIDQSVDDLTNKLNNSGYAFVAIDYKYNKDVKNSLIDIDYQISEGPKVYIDRISISGNTRTLDKVIRRELRIAEGDPFNAAKIRRSKQRIQNLGFFEKVELDSNRSTEENDKAELDIKVEEKSTGELSFGAGFSTNDGALGNVSVRERNLLGRGQDLRLGFQKSSRANQIDLGFTEPYFLGRNIAAGFDLFNITRDLESESSFDSETLGGTLRASYSLTEHLRHSLRYSYKNVNITDVESDASTFIKEQEGENSTSLVGHSLTYDKRDNRFDPTEGYYIRFSQDFAGLGGDSQFIKNEISSAYYQPIFRDDVILSLSGKGGTISGWGNKDVRIDERFFIGGNKIRGFDTAGIGPRDKDTLDALGGNNYYIASTEATFPVGLPEELGFKGAVFIDAGSLFGIDSSGDDVEDSAALRASTGVGVSWQSPLGPIRLDIAYPLLSEDLDEKRTFNVNFGTRF